MALVPATRRAYNLALRYFCAFHCGGSFTGYCPVRLASITMVMAFIARLFSTGLSHSSILAKLSALNFGLDVHSWPSPSNDVLIKKLLMAVRNLSSQPCLGALITLSILHLLLSTSNQINL